MKEGLILENGELVYYKRGYPHHAGVIEWEGSIYYINSKGRAVKGQYIVHGEMTNGLLKRGTYTFGDDCKLIKNSYIPPKKNTGRNYKKDAQLIAVFAVCLLLLCVFFMAGKLDRRTSADTPSTAPSEDRPIIQLPAFEEEVLLCSGAAKRLYDGEMSMQNAAEFGEPYRPFSFEYDIGETSGVLWLSEHEDLANAAEYTLPQDQNEVLIDNLKTGTTYYYKVTAGGEDFFGSFETAQATRYISIPGTINVRDIGGYVTMDGKTIRQGLLIRGPEMDGLVESEYFVPEDALPDVKNTFGFVYDFDLREAYTYEGDYVSRLGADVKHKFYGAPQYAQIFTDAYLPAVRNIFADLAKAENYPMYFHCTYGADRTGTFVFLLYGILNMSEEEMMREYLRTGFTNNSFIEAGLMDPVIETLGQYEGDTLQEQIVTYLTTVVGVTKEEITAIRDIFLEN